MRESIGSDLRYAFVDTGEAVERTTAELHDLAEAFGLVMNRELLDGLYGCLGSAQTELLTWLVATTDDGRELRSGDSITDPEMTDTAKISAFCILQSFFMGYYYDVFGRAVDTSTLTLKVVDGAWGFRSVDILRDVRFSLFHDHPGVEDNTPHVKIIRRQRLLRLLGSLFLGNHAAISEIDRTADRTYTQCMGIVDKRALVINSLLGKCSSPSEIGRFTLLDVDVGGVPRDCDGLIRPGRPGGWPKTDVLDGASLEEAARRQIRERSPPEDATFNIEADWENDPDTALVCARYKGRRVFSFSPVAADDSFCKAFVPPGSDRPVEDLARSDGKLARGIELEVDHFLRGDFVLPCSSEPDVPVLMQALGRPRLRYAVSAMYAGGVADCYVASDSIHAALEASIARGDQLVRKKLAPRPVVLVAGVKRLLDEDRPLKTDMTTLRVHSL